MIGLLLILFVLGISLTQLASCPKSVTLNWLRLGDLISLSMLGVAAASLSIADHLPISDISLYLAPCFILTSLHLILTQLDKRTAQRICAGLIAFTTAIACNHWIPIITPQNLPSAVSTLDYAIALPLSGFLLGGYLMVMLLGHAYLTEGNEMTQAPFKRLTIILGIALLARTLTSAYFGTYAYMQHTENTLQGISFDTNADVWYITMITARYAVGVLIPAVFTFMVYEWCKKKSQPICHRHPLRRRRPHHPWRRRSHGTMARNRICLLNPPKPKHFPQQDLLHKMHPKPQSLIMPPCE